MFPVCTIHPYIQYRSTRFNRSNLTEQQQLKNNYFSGNFYLLQEPGFPDQENRWGAYFLTAFNDYPLMKLQLKRGLFWYGLHPKMHEMVSDRSSWAENWTDLRKISMRVFFDSKKCGKMIKWS